MRLHICLTCGYREHIGGPAVRPGALQHCPECRADGDYGYAMSRIEWQRPDGTTYCHKPRPGMALEEEYEQMKTKLGVVR